MAEQPINDVKPTVTIDGIQYIIEDLPERVRYCLNQIQDLQNQQNQHRARLDQCEMAVNGFLNTVREELANLNTDDDDLEE